ncbi:hypothetical protein HDU97_009761, partial [Phlyctochytrium planicorne]
MKIHTLLLLLTSSAVSSIASPTIRHHYRRNNDFSNLPGPTTTFKNVPVNSTCGTWASRTKDTPGIAVTIADCDAATDCAKPGQSNIGICRLTPVTSSAVISQDGSCGYNGTGGGFSMVSCFPGQTCKFSDGKVLKGQCVKTEHGHDVNTPGLKPAFEVKKVDEECGLLIQREKGVFVFAKCGAGLMCRKGDEKDPVGKCGVAPSVGQAAVIGTDGRCG